MFIKLSVILFVLQIGFAEKENGDWELAVVIDNQIELLQSDGTLIGTTFQQFNKLKALTFDNVRHQFVVSDSLDDKNDTIFTIHLTNKTEITPLISDLTDNVRGLAVDPIDDILYWTDNTNKTINYVPLNKTESDSKILFNFTNESPQDLAIDVCRRYIYWSNSDVNKPTIERAKLDGSERKIIVDSNLIIPMGIAIDYRNQRLYWANKDHGIYFKIFSANLDGTNPIEVYEGTQKSPSSIAVDETAIYWTDVTNNALWRIYKDQKESAPEKIRTFNVKPMGVVAKDIEIKEAPDCVALKKIVDESVKVVEVIEKVGDADADTTEGADCLNGEGKDGKNCKSGLDYERYCHNYCLRGSCYLSNEGFPQCRCPAGWGGSRCEVDKCYGFCLNDGTCRYKRGDITPKCLCKANFSGNRCEVQSDFTALCSLYCRNTDDGVLLSEDHYLMCRCDKGEYSISLNNMTAVPLQPSSLQLSPDTSNVFSKISTDPAYLIQTVLLIISVVAVVALSTYICVQKNMSKRRPRIKKRIIVNKNVTPLTYRPQPATEQCEITIENCCNMNVCETPCFEPPRFRDDKKVLLEHMENDDLNY